MSNNVNIELIDEHPNKTSRKEQKGSTIHRISNQVNIELIDEKTNKNSTEVQKGVTNKRYRKNLTDDHKGNISKSMKAKTRTVTDDELYFILKYKKTSYFKEEIIDIFEKKYKKKICRGLIENIWNGITQPLDSTMKPPDYDEIITMERKMFSRKRLPDCIIEEVFRLYLENVKVKKIVKLINNKYKAANMTQQKVYNITSFALEPRLPTPEHLKLVDEKKDRTKAFKHRQLQDKQIEILYFLKQKGGTQKEAITFAKEQMNIDIGKQLISEIWKQNMRPIKPSEPYNMAISTDIVVKKGKLLNDDQIQEVMKLKASKTKNETVQFISDKTR